MFLIGILREISGEKKKNHGYISLIRSLYRDVPYRDFKGNISVE